MAAKTTTIFPVVTIETFRLNRAAVRFINNDTGSGKDWDNAGVYTNGMAIAAGAIPCETNPTSGKLSRTVEIFHSIAEVTVGSKGPVLHCCQECAAKWHKHREQRPGIRWA